ncbi:META domain-containing protein [Corynebacterium pacaense]|uniref:META domain-containing protein n=1 Tax=Corynebacterium pacaense TaxID=1816684 RepID=UPI0009BA9AB0|nr:META domain-containing protein [Corynebacterium pacaense]
MKLKTLLIALAPLLLGACSSTSSAIDPEGTWGSGAPGQPQLVLAADGSLSGTDGCNRLLGSWELVDDTVELSELASTMMACVDVDTWLGAASTLRVDGDSVRVLDAAGTEIGTLDRQG